MSVNQFSLSARKKLFKIRKNTVYIYIYREREREREKEKERARKRLDSVI